MLLVMMLGLLFLAAAAYFLGDAVTAPARERQNSMRRAARYGTFRPALGRVQLPFKVRVLVPLGDRLAKWTLKLHPKTTIDGVSNRLLAAGLSNGEKENFEFAKFLRSERYKVHQILDDFISAEVRARRALNRRENVLGLS